MVQTVWLLVFTSTLIFSYITKRTNNQTANNQTMPAQPNNQTTKLCQRGVYVWIDAVDQHLLDWLSEQQQCVQHQSPNSAAQQHVRLGQFGNKQVVVVLHELAELTDSCHVDKVGQMFEVKQKSKFIEALGLGDAVQNSLQVLQPDQCVRQVYFASASHDHPHVSVLARQAQRSDGQVVRLIVNTGVTRWPSRRR